MTLQIQAEIAPITIDKDGAARVGGTRVLLQMVIGAFHRGDSPEQIVDSFDTLSLADVYAVIAYYLNHREEVDEYLRQQRETAENLRREIEAHQPQMAQIRERLLARKQSKR
jgi:uncharacterized protein (DUF433 family)